ncbi:TPA: pilus assembly protein [Stenotrophomonas maltophilia]|uniref:pilus assembly protein n=1 Tax=Stenotrophomonas maltophilia TaxID=40324 RepID=UPI0015DF35E7|nr:PilC/PilY family type IV pilus protein [Stenotrophomonas maltophilia]MBA0446869.1 pilus assembly protein [Stenotrophomonas maltophilia]HEL2977447.1 pilus assembly protein [Stenotrophomonas maltophilia]
MNTRNRRILAGVGFAVLAAGGYLVHTLMAAQAQGVLAQEPMNVQVQTPPAFIMAVDDSNSMMFERMFPGGDGRMIWNSSTGSFFSAAGRFSDIGSSCYDRNNNAYADCYLYLYPHSDFNSNYGAGQAIPPLDIFGFARSHTYNASYFNPAVTYRPWIRADGTRWDDAKLTAALVDPRAGFAGNRISYDVTNVRSRSGEAFQFVNGMRIPDLKDTDNRYYRNGSWQTAARSITSSVKYGVEYYPATFYLPENAPAPYGYKSDDNSRPVIAGACGPNCNLRRYQIKSGNYDIDGAYGLAIQNFANWFQYHRNRTLAIVGASVEALYGVDNMRVGYFTINDLKNVKMHDLVTNRADLYTQIYGLNPISGTPNRRAVEYLAEQFRRTDDGAPVIRACQRNGGMLFTDGYTNSGNTPNGSFNNADAVNSTHLPSIPFADGYSNTMADITAAYYAGSKTPLREDTGFAKGQVPVDEKCATLDKSSVEWKRLDCQTDLHMNFYGVTLGAQGRIYGVNAAATADPFKNPPSWNSNPDPSKVDDGTVVDEIWHAALNSRGEFINAQTPNDVTVAMRRVLESITSGKSPSGTLGMTGARIGVGSLSVTPSYDIRNSATDWSSTLKAATVKINSDQVAVFSEAWEASAKLSSTGRRIVANKAGTVVDFGETNISLTDLCSKPDGKYPTMLVCSDVKLKSIEADLGSAIRYLKADATTEKRNGGKYRDRTTPLGDIVTSAPVVSSPVDDYGYRQLGGDYAVSYAKYLETKAKGRRYMVYVGANDGMLHAFDGGMGASGEMDSSGGRESFAYIPATALGHMANLLFPYKADSKDQTFRHRYYVDGPITVSDMLNGSTWQTGLVGTAGAGGRSVFALDVSTPDSFGTGQVMWEINDINPSLAENVRNNIGFVLGKPVIVPVKEGNGIAWKAIFGNGYNSLNRKAVLFVVDMASGSVRMIQAAEGSSASAISGDNGLGSVVVVDRWRGDKQDLRGRDGLADTVYAADQRGAIWKFDLTDGTNAALSVPVFTSKVAQDTDGRSFRQPITGGMTAATGPSGGVMLYFGTGSFSFYSDKDDKSQQALYALNDTSGKRAVTTLTAGNLVQYTADTPATGAEERRIVAGNAPAGARGWMINLPTGNGERFVGNPLLVSGIMFMPTYVPNLESVGCSTSGSNWLFGLSSLTGAAALENVRKGSPKGSKPAQGTAGIALKSEGTAPIRDVSLSVIPRLGSGKEGPPGGSSCWMVVGAAGSQSLYLPYPCGRQSWRQLQ